MMMGSSQNFFRSRKNNHNSLTNSINVNTCLSELMLHV
jgi:hypothetical protein